MLNKIEDKKLENNSRHIKEVFHSIELEEIYLKWRGIENCEWKAWYQNDSN